MFEMFVIVAMLIIIGLVVFGLVLLFKIGRNQKVLQNGQKALFSAIRQL